MIHSYCNLRLSIALMKSGNKTISYIFLIIHILHDTLILFHRLRHAPQACHFQIILNMLNNFEAQLRNLNGTPVCRGTTELHWTRYTFIVSHHLRHVCHRFAVPRSYQQSKKILGTPQGIIWCTSVYRSTSQDLTRCTSVQQNS